MKWIKASDRLPDSSDFWLAKSETQEGKVVLCKVNDIIAHGFFWRRDGRMCFSYSFERKEDGFWHTDDSAFVPYEEFDKIEWLDETPDQPDPLDKSMEDADKRDKLYWQLEAIAKDKEIKRLNKIIDSLTNGDPMTKIYK